jgi:hypothetical protein
MVHVQEAVGLEADALEGVEAFGVFGGEGTHPGAGLQADDRDGQGEGLAVGGFDVGGGVVERVEDVAVVGDGEDG